MEQKGAEKTSKRLKKISYSDKGIRLECYADTLVYKLEHGNEEKRTLAAIRFGGYPEHVKAMSDAIYGGATIESDIGIEGFKFECMTKRYTRNITKGEIYAEATLFAVDESITPVSRGKKEDQEKLDAPPRKLYIFCNENDSDRLFEEIDKRVCVPLIPEFKEYLLQELQARKILNKLLVNSVSEQFEAWELFCTGEDKNIIRAVEDGLKNGEISIPNATQENSAVFETVNTVSEYLKEFGATIAGQIKSRFNPIFDPSTEQLSKEILSVNDNILKNTGYSLYEAQLAVSEAVKRKIDKHEPALIVAECGSGKTKQGAAALYASHLAAGKTKTFFAVISKEKARDGYMHRPVPIWNERKQAFRCPSCNEIIEQELSDDGIKYRVRAMSDFFKKENQKSQM